MHWTAPELFLGGCYDCGGLGEDYRVIAYVFGYKNCQSLLFLVLFEIPEMG